MNKPSSDLEPQRPRRSLRDDRSGATAIEFAFVFPVLVFVSLAIIDFAMVMLNMHRVSDALQRAGREAAVLLPLSDEFDVDFDGSATMTCTWTSNSVCDCGSSSCLENNFDKVVAAAQSISDLVGKDNISVVYEVTDIEEGNDDYYMRDRVLVTVNFSNVQIVLPIFGAIFPNGIFNWDHPPSITLPDMSTSRVIGT